MYNIYLVKAILGRRTGEKKIWNGLCIDFFIVLLCLNIFRRMSKYKDPCTQIHLMGVDHNLDIFSNKCLISGRFMDSFQILDSSINELVN